MVRDFISLGHGQTDFNLNGVYDDFVDVPLNLTGQRQCILIRKKTRKIEFSGSFYVRNIIMGYKLFLYKYYLMNFPENLIINPVEHSEYAWKTKESIQDLNLIDGQLEAFYLACQDC